MMNLFHLDSIKILISWIITLNLTFSTVVFVTIIIIGIVIPIIICVCICYKINIIFLCHTQLLCVVILLPVHIGICFSILCVSLLLLYLWLIYLIVYVVLLGFLCLLKWIVYLLPLYYPIMNPVWTCLLWYLPIGLCYSVLCLTVLALLYRYYVY
jgi:hypothetical protein